ncbi:MAG TPA: M28 family peptidase [Candidatus Sulfopaludibacter sp.]|jgi:Zn-dependent M28 family amino/carboxypeptidase|nr:M28 family peptidase [Candidatus Sulfopaludibacter sp.]
MIAGTLLLAQDGGISAARIREYTKYLSSDLLEGRGVGQRGGDLATQYIANQFALAGAQPAGDAGTYFQKVPLVGLDLLRTSQLTASAGGKSVDFRWGDDFAGASLTQQPDARFSGEVVFVGHGIAAPEYHWDDYKGMDVAGKVLLMFTNEPPSSDPKFFEGRALTYYGRWTYKYEEGLRRGAKAVILIHTTPTAGYGWEVVRSSRDHEAPFVKLEPGSKALSLAGWITTDAAQKMLAMVGKNVDGLLAAAEKPEFRPMDLGIQINGRMIQKIRDIDTRNVAALVPGSDPKLRDEVVVFSAHWDHLGVGAPINGDTIYNGAIDNATGCAILMELANAWSALPQKPKRSALFLSFTAEEAYLKGSEYYAAHPLIAREKTLIDLNYDAIYPFGRARDVVVTGADKTSFWPLVQQMAARMNLEISPEAQPEQGQYFRSDHFALARIGVPAFSIDHATEFAGKPAGYGQKMWQEYNTKHYHQPSDEFQADWDFTALQQAAQYGFLLGREIANR